MPSYTEQDFTADLQRMTGNRTDPALSAALVRDSRAAVGWLAANGVRFQLSFQPPGLRSQDELRAVRNAGVDVFFDTAATSLVTDPTSGAVVGVKVINRDSSTSSHNKVTIAVGAVILAAGLWGPGGFE